MDKLEKLKRDIFRIIYHNVKDAIQDPENIKICSERTSSTLDGCTTETGRVLKNKNKWVSIYIGYSKYCICLARFEANTLKPVQIEIMKCERNSRGNHPCEIIKISSISEIEKYTDKMRLFLKYVLNNG